MRTVLKVDPACRGDSMLVGGYCHVACHHTPCSAIERAESSNQVDPALGALQAVVAHRITTMERAIEIQPTASAGSLPLPVDHDIVISPRRARSGERADA